MALEKVGLQAVIAGMGQFNAASNQIDRTYDRLGSGSEKAAGRMSRLGDIAKIAIGVGVGQIGVQALKSFTGGMVSLVASAAPLVDMEVAARKLSETYGFAFDSMMDSMRTASKGTIADSDLIASANKALIGSGKELGKEFGESLPKLLEIARASAKATGEDVGFLFQSLVLGIKRSSPMIIDNTGLQLKLGEAQEKYAASLGKSTMVRIDNTKAIGKSSEKLRTLQGQLQLARLRQSEFTEKTKQSTRMSARMRIDKLTRQIAEQQGAVAGLSGAHGTLAKAAKGAAVELTGEQKQIALLRATIEAGASMVEAMGSESLTTTEKLAKLRTMGKNLRDQFAKSLVPILDIFLDVLIPIAETLAGKVIPAMERVIIKVTNLAVALRSFFAGGLGRTMWDMLLPDWLAKRLGDVILDLKYFASFIPDILAGFRLLAAGAPEALQELWWPLQELFGIEAADLILDYVAEIYNRIFPIVDRLKKVFGNFGGIVQALGDYFAFTLDEGDALNDSLMDLPIAMRPAIRVIGELIAGLKDLDLTTFFETLRPALEDVFGTELVAGIWDPIVSDLEFARDRMLDIETALPELQVAWVKAMTVIRESAVETWTDTVIPAFDDVIEKIEELQDEIFLRFPQMDKLTMASAVIIGTALLYSVLGPLGLVLASLRLLHWAWEKDWAGMSTIAQGIIDNDIKPALDGVGETLGLLRDAALEKFGEIQTALANWAVGTTEETKKAQTALEEWGTGVTEETDKALTEFDLWAAGVLAKLAGVETSLAEDQAAWETWYTTVSTRLGELRETWIGPLERAIEGIQTAMEPFMMGFREGLEKVLPLLREWASDELFPKLLKLAGSLAATWADYLMPAIDEVTKAVKAFMKEHPAIEYALGTLVYLAGKLAGEAALALLEGMLNSVIYALDLLLTALDNVKFALLIGSTVLSWMIDRVSDWVDAINTAIDTLRTLWGWVTKQWQIHIGITWPQPPAWFRWLQGRSTPPAVLDIRALNMELLQTGRILSRLGAGASPWNVPVPAAVGTQSLATYQTTNVWSPQITAHYQQVQSPTGIMQDMETFAILSRMS